MTLLSEVGNIESVCTGFAGKTAAGNTDRGNTSDTTTGTEMTVSVVMLAVSAVVAVAAIIVDDGGDCAGCDSSGSKVPILPDSTMVHYPPYTTV